MQTLDLHENSGNPVPEGAAPGQVTAEGSLVDCVEKAEQLLDVLKAESQSLKQFDSEVLMRLIPRKEYSLGVLREALRARPSLPIPETAEGAPRTSDRLGSLLAEIDRMNRANAVFIEGALQHYQDLFTTLTPTVYGQNEKSPEHRLMGCRGATIRKRA